MFHDPDASLPALGARGGRTAPPDAPPPLHTCCLVRMYLHASRLSRAAAPAPERQVRTPEAHVGMGRLSLDDGQRHISHRDDLSLAAHTPSTSLIRVDAAGRSGTCRVNGRTRSRETREIARSTTVSPCHARSRRHSAAPTLPLFDLLWRRSTLREPHLKAFSHPSQRPSSLLREASAGGDIVSFIHPRHAASIVKMIPLTRAEGIMRDN